MVSKILLKDLIDLFHLTVTLRIVSRRKVQCDLQGHSVLQNFDHKVQFVSETSL